MRIIAKSTLVKFWSGLPKGKLADAARIALTEWHTTVSDADWGNFSEVKATFNSADYVADGKIVFDVGGNKYRVVGLIGFRTKRVFILFVGTHADYDRIDVAKL
ncbi:MAG: type II toxin-antitoxin system HigB family toxin [Brevundimonas sp.]|uniref:type II toxin-antitoxin system HigB family toxin n=1 Tax=Brevundimonas sp. TaxID=1871086 RepID=UPI0027292B61|nr:type II toxin-antitoxin system HigB family toxin [Brevundimonas sp.]MDO9077520.1 type II toxin-antitoxin system HigB family toxin [Brevundimonas sp.]MDP3079818.1 type II toxin-antitoxin system HigB family toxin [Brevundimonas sp.]MDZ4062140.1 type II toxin-antitoxin system HigB family toxin [Brevundimonas sp.]